MSLIIQGMDMPQHTNPGNGWSQNISDVYIVIDSDDSVYLHYKGKRYLLKEIPTPHGRLIDADNLDCPLGWQGDIVRETVKMAPTVIEAEETHDKT